MAEKKSSTVRTRNFATVVYPESAPDDWLSKLADFCVPAMVSPLHSFDVNPDGEPKKEHYHVMLCFEGPKTIEQAKAIFDSIGGVGCEVINSMRSYARYLCHLDNPDKHQYPIDEVRCFSGADYCDAINLPTDKLKGLKEIMAFCEDNCIDSFYELSMYAAENRMDWFRILAESGSVFMREFLKSKSWTFERRGAGFGGEKNTPPAGTTKGGDYCGEN